MPPLNQRAPEMRLPKRIEEVKVAEAEVLSVVAPAGPTVALALALPKNIRRDALNRLFRGGSIIFSFPKS